MLIDAAKRGTASRCGRRRWSLEILLSFDPRSALRGRTYDLLSENFLVARAMEYRVITAKLVEKLRRDPKSLYHYGKAFIRGYFFVIFCRLFRKNIIIKPPFCVYYKITICGPGSVFIDKNCSVFANSFDGLTIATLSESSLVYIGKGCDLGGVTIRCRGQITIGERSLFANCLIQDTLFISDLIDSKSSKDILLSSAEVNIGDRVWLTDQTIVLGGSKIGDESVLSAGSLCFNRNIPKSHLATGNTIFISMDIDRVEKMVGIP